MNKFRYIAKAVAQRDLRYLRAKITVRPLRLAFLIDENIDSRDFLDILEFNTVLWGGLNSLLIPTNGNSISEEWHSQLRAHNSDVILMCSTQEDFFGDDLVEELEFLYDAYRISAWNEWESAFVKKHAERRQERNGIPIIQFLEHYSEERPEIKEGRSNLRVAECPTESPYFLSIVAQVGQLSGIYKAGFEGIMKAESVAFGDGKDKQHTLSDYLEKMKEFEGRITPLDFTNFRLKRTELMQYYNKPEGLNIFLIGESPIAGICLYWNYRLAPQMMSWAKKSRDLLLPISVLRGKNNLELLANRIEKDEYWNFETINLYSHGLRKNRVARIAEKLKRLIKGNAQLNIINEMPPIAVITLLDKRVEETVLVEDGRLQFKRSWPRFASRIKNATWVNETSLRDSKSMEYGYPDSSKLNSLLCGPVRKDLLGIYDGYWIRQTPGGLSFRVNDNNDFVFGYLPTKLDAYRAFFNDKGFTCSFNNNHSYAQGFKELLQKNGLENILGNPNIRRMLWAMSKSSRGISLDRLKQLLRSGQDVEEIIDSLVASRVLIRGTQFRCEVCGLQSWYPVQEIDEQMICVGCLNNVRLPLRSEFYFKLNQLAATATDLGSIPALLLEDLLNRQTLKLPFSLFGTELTDQTTKSPTEVDYVSVTEGALVMAECKEFKRGIDDLQLEEVIDQMTKLAMVGKSAGAHAILLASFAPNIPERLAKTMLSLGDRFDIPINICDLNEGMVVDLNSPERMHSLRKRPIYFKFKNEG